MSGEPAGSGPEVLVERAGGTAVVSLNRPAVRNALSSGLVAQLAAALATLESDPRVRAVVLTGAPPGFCAGSDLRELAGLTGTGLLAHEARTGQAVRAVATLAVPVVAAVDGFAVGGGFLLAAGCDLVVSAEDARWHLPEVGLGWVPPWGLHALVARVGPVTARRLAWGEAPLTGRELHRLGGVDELAGPGRALPVARTLADRLAALPPHAVASTKRVLAGAAAGPAEALDARATRRFGEDCRSDAAQASLARYAGRGGRGGGGVAGG